MALEVLQFVTSFVVLSHWARTLIEGLEGGHGMVNHHQCPYHGLTGLASRIVAVLPEEEGCKAQLNTHLQIDARQIQTVNKLSSAGMS